MDLKQESRSQSTLKKVASLDHKGRNSVLFLPSGVLV